MSTLAPPVLPGSQINPWWCSQRRSSMKCFVMPPTSRSPSLTGTTLASLLNWIFLRRCSSSQHSSNFLFQYHSKHHSEWILHPKRHMCLHQPVSGQSWCVSESQLFKHSTNTIVPQKQESTLKLFLLFWLFSDLWDDPDTFRPERFLSSSGLLNKEMTEKVLIFGMGKRRCLGDSFARLEMFVFLTTLLHRLQVHSVPGQQLDLSSDFGLTMKPRPYQITVSPRC